MKGRPTPKRRTSRLLALAQWATYSPRSSLLGLFANEGQIRSAAYRGNAGVSGKTTAPRYAATSRRRDKPNRRRARMARLRNVSLRSMTARMNAAGLVAASEPRVGGDLFKHPEWGTIKLNGHITSEQRDRAAERVERKAAVRALRKISIAKIDAIEKELESRTMLDRLSAIIRPSRRSGIRTMSRRSA